MVIAAISHYSYQTNRAGGEIYLKHLLEELAQTHTVSAYFTDTGYDEVVNAVTIKRSSDIPEADLYITQFQNGKRVVEHAHKRKKPVVYIVHNDMLQTRVVLETLNKQDVALFNTHWISNLLATNAKKLVLRPVPKKILPAKIKGEYITLVNPTLAKGASVFYNLALKYPNRKFLIVKGGYHHRDQKIFTFGNVTVHDQTDDMQSIYDMSRIVLMPSGYETFGLVAAEAMSAGIPVLVTDTPGLIENLGSDYPYFAKFNDFKSYHKFVEALDDKTTYAKASQDVINRSKRIDSQKELKTVVNALERLK